ncbi:UNVERIFIED_CONTAM: hypothetical protein FKN15_000059 [Acipenser sinensis]
MVAAEASAPTDTEMENLKELIERLERNAAQQREESRRWRQELGLLEPEPTELDLLLQNWKPIQRTPLSPEPSEEAPLFSELEEKSLPSPEPWSSDKKEEVRSSPPLQIPSASRSGADEGGPLPRPVGYPAGMSGPPSARPCSKVGALPRHSSSSVPLLCSPSRRHTMGVRCHMCSPFLPLYSPWSHRRRYAGPRIRTSARRCTLPVTGLCVGRPGQAIRDLRAGGPLRVEGSGRGMACVFIKREGRCVTQQGGG